MILGLTGGIASGKSTVAAYLTAKGYPVADADGISRKITEPFGEGAKAIEATFGSDFFENNVLNRKKLAEYCFNNSERTATLNGLLHPIITRYMANFTKEAFNRGNSLVIWDVPLLFETGLDKFCDKCAVVICDIETRILRAQARSCISREDILNRIARQMSDDERIRRADFIIDNNGSVENTLNQTDKILEELL